jgi:hypothetical protein
MFGRTADIEFIVLRSSLFTNKYQGEKELMKKIVKSIIKDCYIITVVLRIPIWLIERLYWLL